MSLADDIPEFGPKMQALSEKRRSFVMALYADEAPIKGDGLHIWAAQQAGYGNPEGSTAKVLGVIASRLVQDDSVKSAIAEYSRGLVRAISPEVIRAVRALVRDPKAKDHARAVAMVLDRVDPIETTHTVKVEDYRTFAASHRSSDPQDCRARCSRWHAGVAAADRCGVCHRLEIHGGTMKRVLLAIAIMLAGFPAFGQNGTGPTIKPGSFQSSGAAQYGLAVSTNSTLTVPANTTCAYITVESASVRRTSDGTSATTSVGTLIASGTQWTDCGPLSSYKFTAVSGSPTLDVEYFK